MAKRVKFKLNGKEVEADEGRLVIDAAKDEGVEIPHYCYHPALGNPGNCRMCIVEVAGAPKPQVSCRTGVREGMDVKSDSEVGQARAGRPRWSSTSSITRSTARSATSPASAASRTTT